MTEELPESWAQTTVDDLLGEKIINGRSVPTREGGFPVLRLNAIKDGKIDPSVAKEGEWSESEAEPYLLKAGDFLLSRGNGSLSLVGRGGLVSESYQVAFPDTMMRIRVNLGLVDSKYFCLLWNSSVLRREIESLARTTAGIYKVNQAILQGVHIPLPPRAEQRRIVDALEVELSRLDAADRQLAQAEARLVSLRARFVEDTCLGRGKDSAESSAKLAPAAVDDGMVPSLPAGWAWKRLQEVADVVGGVTKDARKQSDPDCVEVPYLRVANVQKGVLDLTRVNTIRVPQEKALQLELLPGDVLLNEGGDRDKLGRGWVWEGQIPGCIHQNHVFRARVRDGSIHPKLLSWHVNEFGQRWCQANGKQSVNLASISMSKIRLLPIPVPPEEEQAELVKKLETAMSVFDRTAEQLASARAKAAALRQALLNTAFTGKLVPQDPADEPASALLDRLKAEHAIVPAPKRGRRTATSKATSAPVRTSPVTPTRIADDPQPVHAGEQTALEF